MLSHDRVWAAIDALAARHDLSTSGLAKRAGLDSTAFNKSKRLSADGRPRWPSTESVAKVIDATNSSLDEFIALVGADAPDRMAKPAEAVSRARAARSPAPSPRAPTLAAVPLIGFAQAGAGGFFDDAGFPVGQGWDMIDLPGRAGGAYALQVQGESMLPLYRDGDVLVVEPNAQVRIGDRVVVKTASGEVMAKVLARRTVRRIDLISLNPEHPDRTVLLADVDWMARIVWASQ